MGRGCRAGSCGRAGQARPLQTLGAPVETGMVGRPEREMEQEFGRVVGGPVQGRRRDRAGRRGRSCW